MREARSDDGRTAGRVRRLLAASVVVLAGCASAGAPELPTPERIPELEARHRADAGDAGVRLRLAGAYQQAGRAQDAAVLLEPLYAADPGNAAAAFQLGVAYEDLERFADARRLYERYLERGSSPEVRRRVRGRLALLDRRELEAAVRTALAREQELAGVQPAALTVGVFPFLTTDDALSPLGRALAELLTTDLSQTQRLRVLERAQVQLLLDEIALAATGVADPATAARAGRMLGAGQIVQGRVDGGEEALRIQALVVAVGAARDTQAAPVAQQGAIRQLFDMQTALALELFRRLGVELTIAERERVTARPTENVQALLAFGFGLESEDFARWGEAAGHFRRAVELDPGFAEARVHLERAEAIAETEGETPEELALYAALEWDDIAAWLRRRQRYAGVDRMVPNPEVRDPTAEVLGLEGLERSILIDLIIRRPGGAR